MTKLLQGKSLYIAKHMHGQLIHADIDDHTDPRPKSRLAPCISKCSLGNTPIDTRQIYLRERAGPKRTLSGEKIGYNSFIFKNLPEKLYDAYAVQRPIWHLERTGQHLYSFRDVATLHWLKVTTEFTVRLTLGVPFGEDKSYTIADYKDYCIVRGDNYGCSHTLPSGNSFGLTITWLPNVNEQERLAVSGYSFPPIYNMRVYWGISTVYPVWSCYRNEDGTYEPPTGVYA